MELPGAAFTFTQPESSPERKAFYGRLDQKNSVPLWQVLSGLVTAAPAPQTIAALWRYEEMRPLLLEAGRLLTAREAERRVLVLENPGARGQARITQSLYAGLQLILPGEVAPCHRHAAGALRFLIEGSGAYTSVEGERTTMYPGDLVLTPSWTYHDHGNPANEPVIWLDGLDVPIVNLFDTSFAEHYPGEVHPNTIAEGDSRARYGANMLPVDYVPERSSSVVFSYPYARTREALDELQRNGPVHECHGIKMRYVNPANGGYPMPTIGAFMQLLPAGFCGVKYRATDGAVYAVVEGKGRTRVGTTTLTWGPRDIFVVPSWAPVSHETDGEAVLFSFSDRPAQQSLGLWREEVPLRG
jgi:gentisate 1,2-dioxygenase